MKLLYSITILLAIACSSQTTSTKISSRTFENVAIVNYDSCKNWSLPLTSFRIKYPVDYTAVFHQNNAYLDLKKFGDSGIIEQVFSFGKSQNIKTKTEIEEWTYRADSAFTNFRTYNTKSINYETIANMNLFVVNSTINFDHLNQPEYKGDYRIQMMIIPTDKQPNGVSVSILTRSTLDSLKRKNDIDQILQSLDFSEK